MVNYLVSALVEAFIRSLWTKCCLSLAVKMKAIKELEIEEERERWMKEALLKNLAFFEEVSCTSFMGKSKCLISKMSFVYLHTVL